METGRNMITARARGARASTGIMASAVGVVPHSDYSFNAGRSHSIFSAPLQFRTRLQSSRQSLTAEPNSAVEDRHPGTQTGIVAVTTSPAYPPNSPFMLGQPATGGTAQSQFGIPTLRGAHTAPGQVLIPIMQRKQIAALRLVKGRASSAQ